MINTRWNLHKIHILPVTKKNKTNKKKETFMRRERQQQPKNLDMYHHQQRMKINHTINETQIITKTEEIPIISI